MQVGNGVWSLWSSEYFRRMRWKDFLLWPLDMVIWSVGRKDKAKIRFTFIHFRTITVLSLSTPPHPPFARLGRFYYSTGSNSQMELDSALFPSSHSQENKNEMTSSVSGLRFQSRQEGTSDLESSFSLSLYWECSVEVMPTVALESFHIPCS